MGLGARWHLLQAPAAAPPTRRAQTPGSSSSAKGEIATSLATASPVRSASTPYDAAGLAFPSARHGHACQYLAYDCADGSRTHELVLFWGGSYGIKSDAFAYDLDRGVWRPLRWRCASAPTPAAACATTTDGDAGIYIFGGVQERSGGDVVTNELLLFDARSRAIMPLIPADHDVLPIQRLGASATFVPALNTGNGNGRPTSGLDAVAIAPKHPAESTKSPKTISNTNPRSLNLIDDPCLYVFGGLGADHLPLQELGAFSIDQMHWVMPVAAGKPPVGRESHSAVYWPGSPSQPRRIVLYGGFAGQSEAEFRRLDDVVFYNIDQQTWESPNVSGVKPLGRSLHSSVALGSKMIVFGGWEQSRDPEVSTDKNDRQHQKENGDACDHDDADITRRWQCSNTVAVFDIERAKWEPIECVSALQDGSIPSAPLPRAGHAATLVGNMMLVVGGNLGNDGVSDRQVCTNDVWALEIGPPPPPGMLSVRSSVNTALPLGSDDVAQGTHIIVFDWADEYAWFPNRTYRLLVQDIHEPQSEWRVLYQGSKRKCVVPLVPALTTASDALGNHPATDTSGGCDGGLLGASGMPKAKSLPVDELIRDRVYLARVISVNFAGDSSQWPSICPNATIQRPVIIRNGEIITVEEAAILPDKLAAVLLISSLDAGPNHSNLPNTFIEVSWKDAGLPSVAAPKFRLEARAFGKISLPALEARLHPPESASRTSSSSKKSRKSRPLSESPVVPNNVASTSVDAQREFAVDGQWASIWTGTEAHFKASLTLLMNRVLDPCLHACLPTLSEIRTMLQDSAALDFPYDSLVGKRKRKRQEDLDSAKPTSQMLSGCLSSLSYEFRIGFARSGRDDPSREWTQSEQVALPETVLADMAALAMASASAAAAAAVPKSPAVDKNAHGASIRNKEQNISSKSSLSATPILRPDDHLDDVDDDTNPSESGSRQASKAGSRSSIPISRMQSMQSISQAPSNTPCSDIDVMGIEGDEDSKAEADHEKGGDDGDPSVEANPQSFGDDPNIIPGAYVPDVPYTHDTTVLPTIGDPNLPFYFNLGYGDRLEIYCAAMTIKISSTESKSVPSAWYPARALYYTRIRNTNTWKIMVHYMGYKKYDEFITIDPVGVMRMRPWSGSPQVMELHGIDPEDISFSMDLNVKSYNLSQKAKIGAIDGKYIIKA